MKRDQIHLFDMAALETPLADRVNLALSTIQALFEDNVPVCVAFSGGKDSTVCADLTLRAAINAAQTPDVKPWVIVTTSDTLVENPEITQHYRKELQLMKAFGKLHKLRVTTRVATPSLLSTWQMKTLSGRGLPSFAGLNTDCSQDLKVKPQAVLRREIFKDIEDAGHKQAVTVLGTRHEESTKRALNMKIRGENATVPVPNKDGDLILSPICNWETDDIFEYLGTRNDGLSYSDFKETLRIYAHSEGTSCAVVAASIEEGGTKRKKGGCGTRTGCHVCQQSNDKSLENLIEFDRRYEYARGLNRLNKFIRNTRYDLSRRNWVGRRILGGYIAIAPDTYHPRMVREIFRYMIQLQFDEKIRAAAAGEFPKFILFTEEMVLALDAYWSLTGLAHPFSAWLDLQEITSGKVRYDIPDVELVPPNTLPDPRFLFVGTEWDDSASSSEFTGMRDAYTESLLEISACRPALRTTEGGQIVWKTDEAPSFTIDGEGLFMFMDFELERKVEECRSGHGRAIPGAITSGYMWYLSYGLLSMSNAQAKINDKMLRRTAHKDRLGMCVDYDIAELISKSIPFHAMPKEAREAWSHKATTSSAQADLELS
jgi:DNA sulfur modification protein DndC